MTVDEMTEAKMNVDKRSSLFPVNLEEKDA